MRPLAPRLLLPLAFVVITAGCLGGTGPTSTTGPPDTEWATGDRINTSELATHHFRTLRSAGSFTVNHSETIRVNGEVQPDGPRPAEYTPPSFARKRVNLDTGRYLDTYVTVGYRRSNHFITPDVTAKRQRSCPNCSYESTYQQRPDGDTLSKRIDRFRSEEAVTDLAQFLRGVTVGFNYTYAGTAKRDGKTLYRYQANRILTTAPPPFAEPPRGTATILVTGDGVIRHFELQYAGPATVTSDGEEQTVTVTQTFVQTYTALGETTIQRLAWVDRMANDDSSRTTKTSER